MTVDLLTNTLNNAHYYTLHLARALKIYIIQAVQKAKTTSYPYIDKDVAFLSDCGAAVAGETQGANEESRRSNGVGDNFGGRSYGETHGMMPRQPVERY